jgi:hypothetical protein
MKSNAPEDKKNKDYLQKALIQLKQRRSEILAGL